jgi:hypothetical protein
MTALEAYDRDLAKLRARFRKERERNRAAQLEALKSLPPADWERRERDLRAAWWLADYRRALDDRVRRDALIARLAAIDQNAATARRAEERAIVADVEAAMRTYRGPILHGRGKTPIGVAHRFNRIRLEQSGDEVPALRAEVERWARDLGVRVQWSATPGANGYAWRGQRAIEVAPIRSEAAFAVAMHELGHCAHPCQPDHVRVRLHSRRTACVPCELAAWMFAIDTASAWSRPMHTEMADALGTYRQYATATEQAEIDSLCGGLGFRRMQVRRAIRDRRRVPQQGRAS